MKTIAQSNAVSRQACWVISLLAIVYLLPAHAGDIRTGDPISQTKMVAAMHIVDPYGRQAPTGKRDAGSQIFDVEVGPKGNEFQFVPDAINIRMGDTVRWTWASDSHSVTSGTSCTADGQFCSPDNTNCEAGALNDTGFVYEYTFTEPGTYQYFCALHCFAAMTGVVNVMPPSRPNSTPRPRPTPVPRPAL